MMISSTKNGGREFGTEKHPVIDHHHVLPEKWQSWSNKLTQKLRNGAPKMILHWWLPWWIQVAKEFNPFRQALWKPEFGMSWFTGGGSKWQLSAVTFWKHSWLCLKTNMLSILPLWLITIFPFNCYLAGMPVLFDKPVLWRGSAWN